MKRIFFNEVVTRDGFQMAPDFVPTDAKVRLIDHKGLILNFTDPAGLRMEITTPLDKYRNRRDAKAKADNELWVENRHKAGQEGRDVVDALTWLCVDVRKRYEHYYSEERRPQ